MNASSFYGLTNDAVLNCVESALDRSHPGLRATGSIFALNSLENRVYQLDFEDGLKVVTKFYRPQRWSAAQIVEEHHFLQRLIEAEVPVVAPLVLKNNETLGISPDGIFFAVFPLVKGRLLDELSTTHLQTLGRYVARIHRLGMTQRSSLRPALTVENFGWEPLDFLMESDVFETEALMNQYEATVTRLLTSFEPLFDGAKYIITHGDCHLGNTLWHNDAPFFLDFDDLRPAPAVQDIWMIVRGRDENALSERKILLKSYEQMNTFNESELSLIEPLRALRIIHYSAWIAERWEDPSFPQAFPDFGSTRYWHDEISELTKIQEYFQ